MKTLFTILFLAAFSFGVPTISYAQMDSDTSDYLSLVNKLKDAPVDTQIREFKQFLVDHPNTTFKGEIESNIQELTRFINQADPQKKKEKQDAETFQKALKFSQRLTLEDQADMWQQFLGDHPSSLYVNEARTKLLDARKRLGLNPDGSKPSENRVKVEKTFEPIASDLAYKSHETALLLSTFAGLVVPGIGHWYTKDYAIAGILTALRIAGGAILLNGILVESDPQIILGSVIAGTSYFGDVFDASYSVDRYNEALEKKKGLQVGWTFRF